MNIRNTIGIGVLVGTLVSIGLVVSQKSNKPKYTPREEAFANAQLFNGAANYAHMLRANQQTGRVDKVDFQKVKEEVTLLSKRNNKSALNMEWQSYGPDNVGGRTRAILVDKDDDNLVYAGGISGGLFVSTDQAATWTPVEDHNLGDNLVVSCITQTENGRIFFGTGTSFESVEGNSSNTGVIGNGLYEYDVESQSILPVVTSTSDEGLPNNASNAAWSEINALANDGNTLYVATNRGLFVADPDGNGDYPNESSEWTNPVNSFSGNANIVEQSTCQDIDITSGGSIYATYAGGVFRSTPATASASGFTLGEAGSFEEFSVSGSQRMAVAVAPTDENYVYMVAVDGSACLLGFYMSTDAGENWEELVPGGAADVDPFQSEFRGGVNCQGRYDMAIVVDPSDKNRVLVGGISLRELIIHADGTFDWEQVASGNELLAPFYVHADIHTFYWKDPDLCFIGCDGGIFKSIDGAFTWTENNLGFNVTQFYDIAVNDKGWIAGGTQDNGTQMFSFGSKDEITPLGATQMLGGDGFSTAFSNFGTGVLFSSVYFGALNRGLIEVSRQGQSTFFADELNTCGEECGGAFFTQMAYWESANDPYSNDSVAFTVDEATSWDAGETLTYESRTNAMKLYQVLTSSLSMDVGDTLILPDPISSKLAFAAPSPVNGNSSIYLTRDAASLNIPDPDWDLIADNTSSPSSFTGTVNAMEFSDDGNILYVGTTTGSIYRIDSLGLAVGRHTPDVTTQGFLNALNINEKGDFIECTQIANFNRTITGIAVDPNNANNIIVTLGNYGNSNYVYRCTSAAELGVGSGTTGFTSIQGPNYLGTGTIPDGYLPKMPVYDAEIDMNDNDIVILATEWGVWSTSNAFSASTPNVLWYDESVNGMAHVPVYTVLQQQMPLGTARGTAENSMVYYLGTHGRGFYASSSLVDSNTVSVNELSATQQDASSNSVDLYPNPVENNTTLSFVQSNTERVSAKVYSLRGRLIHTVDFGVLAKGEHEEDLSLTDLPVGSYLLSLESESSRKVTRFIKLK